MLLEQKLGQQITLPVSPWYKEMECLGIYMVSQERGASVGPFKWPLMLPLPLWFLKETHSVIPCMILCMVPFLSSPYLPLLRWFFWHGAPISLNSSLLEVRECILFSLLQPSTVVKLKRDLIQLVWFPIKSPPKVKCIWVSGREKEVLGVV